MLKQHLLMLLITFGLIAANSSQADLTLLSDNELVTQTAQNNLGLNNHGQITLARQAYIESAQLNNLYAINKSFVERGLYLIEFEKLTVLDADMLAEQIEISLISLSAQLATAAASSVLNPILGFSFGIGGAALPDTFNVVVTDVVINTHMTMTIRD